MDAGICRVFLDAALTREADETDDLALPILREEETADVVFYVTWPSGTPLVIEASDVSTLYLAGRDSAQTTIATSVLGHGAAPGELIWSRSSGSQPAMTAGQGMAEARCQIEILSSTDELIAASRVFTARFIERLVAMVVP